jgi:hypothetical protein
MLTSSQPSAPGFKGDLLKQAPTNNCFTFSKPVLQFKHPNALATGAQSMDIYFIRFVWN